MFFLPDYVTLCSCQSLGHLGTSPGHAKLGADGGVGALAMGALEIAMFRCHQRNPRGKMKVTQRERDTHTYIYIELERSERERVGKS